MRKLITILIVIAAIAIPGCKDEDPTNQANSMLQGDCKVTSYIENGLELVGYDLFEVQMSFTRTETDRGTYNWSYADSFERSYYVNNKIYELLNKGTEIQFENGILKLSFADRKAFMRGILDGMRVEIEGTRR